MAIVRRCGDNFIDKIVDDNNGVETSEVKQIGKALIDGCKRLEIGVFVCCTFDEWCCSLIHPHCFPDTITPKSSNPLCIVNRLLLKQQSSSAIMLLRGSLHQIRNNIIFDEKKFIECQEKVFIKRSTMMAISQLLLQSIVEYARTHSLLCRCIQITMFAILAHIEYLLHFNRITIEQGWMDGYTCMAIVRSHCLLDQLNNHPIGSNTIPKITTSSYHFWAYACQRLLKLATSTTFYLQQFIVNQYLFQSLNWCINQELLKKNVLPDFFRKWSASILISDPRHYCEFPKFITSPNPFISNICSWITWNDTDRCKFLIEPHDDYNNRTGLLISILPKSLVLRNQELQPLFLKYFSLCLSQNNIDIIVYNWFVQSSKLVRKVRMDLKLLSLVLNVVCSPPSHTPRAFIHYQNSYQWSGITFPTLISPLLKIINSLKLSQKQKIFHSIFRYCIFFFEFCINNECCRFCLHVYAWSCLNNQYHIDKDLLKQLMSLTRRKYIPSNVSRDDFLIQMEWSIPTLLTIVLQSHRKRTNDLPMISFEIQFIKYCWSIYSNCVSINSGDIVGFFGDVLLVYNIQLWCDYVISLKREDLSISFVTRLEHIASILLIDESKGLFWTLDDTKPPLIDIVQHDNHFYGVYLNNKMDKKPLMTNLDSMRQYMTDKILWSGFLHTIISHLIQPRLILQTNNLCLAFNTK